eukprot:29590_1
MASMKKRKIVLYQPPAKKQRSTNQKDIKSIFNDVYNHQQFLSIFKVIEKCELINNLRISADINKEIGEYCVGDIHICSIKDCLNEIFILNNNDLKDRGNTGNAEFDYCDETEKFYCHECIDKVEECLCCMAIVPNVTCSVCNYIICCACTEWDWCECHGNLGYYLECRLCKGIFHEKSYDGDSCSVYCMACNDVCCANCGQIDVDDDELCNNLGVCINCANTITSNLKTEK